MAVYRTRKSTNFTRIDNVFLKDKQLSLQAKGLFTLMLSLPDSWEYSIADLVAICREGKDAIRSAIHELEEAGYIVRNQSVDANRKFSKNVYDIFERLELRDSVQRITDNPSADNPSAGNPLAEMPTTACPTPEDTLSDRQTQETTKVCFTKQENTDQSNTDTRIDRDADFERLWAAYPRKENRSAAYSAFREVDVSVEVLIAAVEKQRSSRAWCADNGRYIPYLSNWLKDRRWEDITSPATTGYIRHDDPISPRMLKAVQEMLEEPI